MQPIHVESYVQSSATMVGGQVWLAPGISFKKPTGLSIRLVSQLSVISNYGDILPHTVTVYFSAFSELGRDEGCGLRIPTPSFRFYFLKSFSQTPNPEITFPFLILIIRCISILAFKTSFLISVTCFTTTYVKPTEAWNFFSSICLCTSHKT